MNWTYYTPVNTIQSKKADFTDTDPLSNVSILQYLQSIPEKPVYESNIPKFKTNAYLKLKEYRKLPVTYHSKSDTANSIMKYLINQYGFTDVAARAFAGQVYRENRFNIKAVNKDEQNSKDGVAEYAKGKNYGSGLIQFTGDLKKKAEKLLGKKVENATLQEQLSVLEPLYTKSNPTVWNELKHTNDMERALDLTYAGLVAANYSADKINPITRQKIVDKYKKKHKELGYKVKDTWQIAADWAYNDKPSE